jgi:hypothetical protein
MISGNDISDPDFGRMDSTSHTETPKFRIDKNMPLYYFSRVKMLLKTISRIIPMIAALALFSACDDDAGIIRLPEPEVQIDELKQRAAAAVDILWVIDSSESMVQEQELLAQNFDRFITGLTVCQGSETPDDICDFTTKKCSKSGNPCNPPDYHIGVISTDTRSASASGRLRKAGICVPRPNSAPVGNKTVYCAAAADCNDNSHPSFDMQNSHCDLTQAITFIQPSTPAAKDAFGRLVKVGVQGSALESGIQAAAQALGRDANRQTGEFNPTPAENAGFMRGEASLFVIFVSDEDDSSFGRVSYFYRTFESLKGAGNEGLISFSAIVGDPDPDGTGPVRGGCPAEPNSITAFPGTRYVALAMYSRGLSSEFRVCDDTRLPCPQGSACQKPITEFPRAGAEIGVCVPTGECQIDQDCGNFKCAEDKGCMTCENNQCGINSERFIQLLERNGVFGSICEPDYAVVLGALGFEAAGLRRKFELTKFPDCSKPIDCGGKSSAICVRVNGVVLPNERDNGWVWEPTSNAIFFDGDFVPPTDANIEISYSIARAGAAEATKALSCDSALK